MKGLFFGFGVHNNRLNCMQGQKTLSSSYNMHLFLPYLLIDSQMIDSTIIFFKPLLCVMIICGDWSDWSHFHFIMPAMADKAVFVSVLLCVNRYERNNYFSAPIAAPFNDSESTFSFERQ